MCIIAYKPNGINMPSDDILKECWIENPDGAGFMYKIGSERVVISKGYMDFDEFLDAIHTQAFTARDEVVMHFRIGTSGGNIPANTHPFPISHDLRDLKKLQFVTDRAMAHNGVFGAGEKRNSDTQVYVRDVLGRKHVQNNLGTDHIRSMIETTTKGSKVIIFREGEWDLYGDWKTDANGVKYSNNTYDAETNYEWACYMKGGMGRFDGNTIKPSEFDEGDEYLVCGDCGTEDWSDVFEVEYTSGDKVEVYLECPSCHSYNVLAEDELWEQQYNIKYPKLNGNAKANEAEAEADERAEKELDLDKQWAEGNKRQHMTSGVVGADYHVLKAMESNAQNG